MGGVGIALISEHDFLDEIIVVKEMREKKNILVLFCSIFLRTNYILLGRQVERNVSLQEGLPQATTVKKKKKISKLDSSFLLLNG